MAHALGLPASRSLSRLAAAGTLVLALGQGAFAEDGLQHWFSSVFGGGERQPAAQQAPAPGHSMPRFHAFRPRFDDRDVRASNVDRDQPARWRRRWIQPLVVRLHRPATVQVPGRPEIVSIFMDRTLRRGDAVMTGDGMRVFAGSTSWPYAKSDFVAVGNAKHLSRSTTKVLADLNLLPRD